MSISPKPPVSISRRQLLLSGAATCSGAWVPRAFAADAGVSEREILIGQSAVLSGPLGLAVKAFNAGAALAFDGVNGEGGIHGRSIRLFSLDDGLKADLAVANYKSLLKDRQVFAFFGGVGSGPIAAAAPVLRESNAPLIGNYALSDAARDQVRGAAYFVRATYGREAEKLVQHLATIGITRIAVAHLANPGGEEVLALVRKAIVNEGQAKDVVGSVAVKNDGTNVQEGANKLAGMDAQIILMFLGGPPVPELMRTLWSRGGRFTFYGMSVIAGDQVAKSLGAQMRSLVISQVVPYPWSEADRHASEFRARCAAAKVPANYSTYEGYINGSVLIEALRRVGPAPTRAALHGVMRAMKLRIGEMGLDFTGGRATGGRYVDLVHVRGDGRFAR